MHFSAWHALQRAFTFKLPSLRHQKKSVSAFLESVCDAPVSGPRMIEPLYLSQAEARDIMEAWPIFWSSLLPR